MQYHAIPCNTMQYHAIQCNTMQYHAIPCNKMQYHAIPCNTMQYHATPCNTIQYHVIPCNIMQYHAIPVSPDSLFVEPMYLWSVGSIWPFLLLWHMYTQGSAFKSQVRRARHWVDFWVFFYRKNPPFCNAVWIWKLQEWTPFTVLHEVSVREGYQ